MNIDKLKLDNLKKALDEYCEKFAATYKDKLTRDNKSASGALISTIKTEVRFLDDRFEAVIYVQDYWKYVENGRKPGTLPPIASIEGWIMKKGLPRPANLTLQQQAWSIAKGIERNGIKPGHQFKDTMDELNTIYKEKIRQAMQQDIDIFSLNIINDVSKITKNALGFAVVSNFETF